MTQAWTTKEWEAYMHQTHELIMAPALRISAWRRNQIKALRGIYDAERQGWWVPREHAAQAWRAIEQD